MPKTSIFHIILLMETLALRLSSFAQIAKCYQTVVVKLVKKHSKSLVHEVITYIAVI
jgi:hypothetical protein